MEEGEGGWVRITRGTRLLSHTHRDVTTSQVISSTTDEAHLHGHSDRPLPLLLLSHRVIERVRREALRGVGLLSMHSVRGSGVHARYRVALGCVRRSTRPRGSTTAATSSFPSHTALSVARARLMLAASQQSKPNGTMVARVLVMVSEAIHIFVSSLAVGHAASVWLEVPLSLLLDLQKFLLRMLNCR